MMLAMVDVGYSGYNIVWMVDGGWLAYRTRIRPELQTATPEFQLETDCQNPSLSLYLAFSLSISLFFSLFPSAVTV